MSSRRDVYFFLFGLLLISVLLKINSTVDYLQSELWGVERAVDDIKSDVSSIKSDVSSIESDVADLHSRRNR